MRTWPCIFLVLVFLLMLSPSFAQPLLWKYSVVNYVTSISISANGNYVVVGNRDGLIYLLERETGKKLWSYTVPSRINVISISKDGSYMAVGLNNRLLYLFDKNLSGNSYLWSRTLGASVLSLAVSEDGGYIAAGCHDRRVYFFERKSSQPLWSYMTNGRVMTVDVSGSGEIVAAGSEDGYLYVFDREYTGNTFVSRFKTEDSVVSISISEEGYSIAAGSLDGYVYFQDRRITGDSYTWRHRADSEHARITSVSTSSDGDFIAAGDSSGKIYFFDRGYTTNGCKWTYPVGNKSTIVSISGDGGLVASRCDKGVYLFDKGFKNNVFLWYLHSSSIITDVKISSDGSSVAAGDEDGYVYMLWPSIESADQTSIETTSTSEERSSPTTYGTTTGTMTETMTETMTGIMTGTMTGIVTETRQKVETGLYAFLVATLSAIVVLVYFQSRKDRKEVKPRRVSKNPLGYKPLDTLLDEEVPESYSIVLCSPPCDQKDEVIKGYLKAGLKQNRCIYISNTVDKIADFLNHPNIYAVVCNPQADDIAPSSANVEKIKNIGNLTELNISLMNLLEKLYDKHTTQIRICFDILDDVLIHHKGTTTRRWLLELIPRMKRMKGMVLATVDSKMHLKEDLYAILGVFDGQVDITEEKKKGKIQRKISLSRMYGISYSKEEIQI